MKEIVFPRQPWGRWKPCVGRPRGNITRGHAQHPKSVDDIFYYLFTRVYAAAQAVSHGIRAVHTVIHIDAGVIYKSRVALEINSRGVEHFLISSHGRNGGGRGEIGSRYPSINTRFFQLFSLLFRSNHSSRLVNHRFSRVMSRKKFQDFRIFPTKDRSCSRTRSCYFASTIFRGCTETSA